MINSIKLFSFVFFFATVYCDRSTMPLLSNSNSSSHLGYILGFAANTPPALAQDFAAKKQDALDHGMDVVRESVSIYFGL